MIVGEIVPGDCVGEVFLRGRETQPFSIITSTPHTKFGWIESQAIKGTTTDVELHLHVDICFSK